MGYFDNPKHRAEWEKELAALREQKARLHGGASAASREGREYEQPVYNRDISEQYSAPAREEYTAPAREERTAPAREERTTPAREERTAPAREERTTPAREERTAPAREEYTAPAREERTAPVRVNNGEKYRVRMTFNELLAMENMNNVQKTTARSHEMQRQKEVTNAL